MVRGCTTDVQADNLVSLADRSPIASKIVLFRLIQLPSVIPSPPARTSLQPHLPSLPTPSLLTIPNHFNLHKMFRTAVAPSAWPDPTAQAARTSTRTCSISSAARLSPLMNSSTHARNIVRVDLHAPPKFFQTSVIVQTVVPTRLRHPELARLTLTPVILNNNIRPQCHPQSLRQLR